jgi:hypothetical protein
MTQIRMAEINVRIENSFSKLVSAKRFPMVLRINFFGIAGNTPLFH